MESVIYWQTKRIKGNGIHNSGVMLTVIRRCIAPGNVNCQAVLPTARLM